jgi:hypothetical protein
MKIFKNIVLSIQIVAVMFFIGFGIYLSINSDNYYAKTNGVFYENLNKLVQDVISLEKTKGVTWIFLNNFKTNAIQSVLSFFTLGITGILSLSKDFLIYGFALWHCKNIFVLFELITSIISIYISTCLSFDMYFKKRKVSECIYDLSKVIILSCIPLIIGAIIEGNLIYK